MRELCVAGFRDAKLLKISKGAAECSLEYLVRALRRQKSETPVVLVASRDRPSSHEMDLDHLRSHPQVKVLWMLREPRDVLTSVHPDKPGTFYVKPERLIQSLELYLRCRNEPQVVTVRYEDLVLEPNSVQKRIGALLGLKKLRLFTKGYEHFPRFRENVRAMHSIRPIDADSLHRWKANAPYKEYLRHVFSQYPELRSLARKCGYRTALR